jgi:hypothetical protein
MRTPLILIFFLIILDNCREPYQPPVAKAQSNLLVVDAFLDGTEKSCTVVLSRSQDISDTDTVTMERNAKIQLADSKGNIYVLTEMKDGNYSVSSVTIDTQMKYQLRIQTKEKKYQSNFVDIKNTPPIDDITWEENDQGLQFYVSTHDDEKKSIYYQYRYVETWAYVAPLESGFEIIDGALHVRIHDIYHCWRTVSSANISIATSVKLSEDIISNFPFYLIEKPSQKLLMRYSILVKQNTVTVDEYNYWKQLQKNTEKLGTLFDPQPSQILSNVQNVDNPDEPVLGYFSAGITTSKRIFVNASDLKGNYYSRYPVKCALDSVPIENLASSGLLLIQPYYKKTLIAPDGYLGTTVFCADCRQYGGGTLTKPDFW